MRQSACVVRQRNRLRQPDDRTGPEGSSVVMNAPARTVPMATPSISIRNYAIVTAAYWAFTLTDGALRMLVLLHFNQLGYSPVQLAFLFLLYEFFGIVTNLVGGWVATRTGVRFTLVGGLTLQVLVPKGDDSGLFKWVAVLTGSKNALKGAGFFVGGFLLSLLGFRGALAAMAS